MEPKELHYFAVDLQREVREAIAVLVLEAAYPAPRMSLCRLRRIHKRLETLKIETLGQ